MIFIPFREKSECSHIFEVMQFEIRIILTSLSIVKYEWNMWQNAHHLETPYTLLSFKKINFSHITEDETLFIIVLPKENQGN